MIIYLQWAMAVPEDWTAVDVTNNNQIRRAAKKALPTGGEVLDNTPGWLLTANCQGIEFSGMDHTAIEVLQGNGLRITVWNDDPEDFPPGTRFAVRWELMPPAFDSHPLVNQINTVQTRTLWGESNSVATLLQSPNSPMLPWSDFVLPPANMTFHGIWVTDEQFQQHISIRTPRGWREWI